MSMKPKRTLGPAAFEAYMDFADSLKDGTNNDSIDRFKYRFAVKEGYIRPKKAMTEAVAGGKLTLDAFEQAFKGLVGGFLPYLDQDEQQILSGVCASLDEKLNGGDVSGAQDILKGAMRDAGADTDEYDDDVSDDESDDDGCATCQDDKECPDGQECKDGKCTETEKTDSDDGEKPAEVECCQKTPKANSAKAKVDSINTELPGFGADDTESYSLDDESGSDVDDIIRQNDAMDVYPSGSDSKNATGLNDYGEDFDASSDVDYDKLADMILSDNGYGNMTTANGGVGARNRAMFNR